MTLSVKQIKLEKLTARAYAPFTGRTQEEYFLSDEYLVKSRALRPAITKDLAEKRRKTRKFLDGRARFLALSRSDQASTKLMNCRIGKPKIDVHWDRSSRTLMDEDYLMEGN